MTPSYLLSTKTFVSIECNICAHLLWKFGKKLADYELLFTSACFIMSTKCTHVSETMQTREVLVSGSRRWRWLRTSNVTWPLLFQMCYSLSQIQMLIMLQHLLQFKVQIPHSQW